MQMEPPRDRLVRPLMAPSARRDRLLGVVLLLCAIAVIQLGASIAKTLFAQIGASGTVTLRLLLATALLWMIQRPWRTAVPRSAWPLLLAYGTALGLMNLLFYLSLRTVPVGLAVALEFSGPLTLTLAATRRLKDLPWLLLALAGLAVLLPVRGVASVDPLGSACALGAGACWAAYMITGRRLGGLLGKHAAAWGMPMALLCVLPFGCATAGWQMLQPSVLPTALAVAILSSAIPYPLEMAAMQRLPTRMFGVLLSLDPVMAALAGWMVLGEALAPLQLAAIAAIMLASAGSTRD